MKLNFKYWQLDNFKLIELNNITYPTINSVPVFFTNKWLICTATQEQGEVVKQLQSYFETKREIKLSIQSISSIDLQTSIPLQEILILLDGKLYPQLLDAFFMEIRDHLAKDQDNTCIFLASSDSYQKIQNDTIRSLLATDYYLIMPSVLIQTDKYYTLAELWTGEGWFCPTVFTYQKNKNQIAFNGAWIPFVNEQLYDLAERCSGVLPSKTDKDLINERKEKYLQVLEACLPYQKSSKGLFIPSHAQPWSGPFEISENGPMDSFLLSNGTKDSSYHYLIRELILEGWLSIWKHGDRYVAHTASFALLYWTASYLGKKYTKTPQDFLEHYELLPEDGWFGGHWKEQSLNEEQNNV